MTTYKKLTWDSYKIQVESAVRDGNGATISTTYATKTELTTGLGNKLDTTTAASTYLTITSASSTYLSKTDAASTYATQTALSNGLAAKADKATSLAGYGITDGVTTNTAQTITEVKTFTHANGAVILKRNEAYSSGQAWSPYIEFKTDTGDVAIGRLYARRDSANNGNFVVDVREPTSGDWKGSLIFACNSSESWLATPTRAYNSGHTTDVVTIGSLAANPSVVHTTGNEIVYGEKTFDSEIIVRNSRARLGQYITDGSNKMLYQKVEQDDGMIAQLELHVLNGTAYVDLAKCVGGVWQTPIRIATL